MLYLPGVWELERFQTTQVTFKAIQGHWQWCHLIGNIRFPISLPLQLFPPAPLPRYYQLFLGKTVGWQVVT